MFQKGKQMRKTSLRIIVLLAVVMLAGCGKQTPVAEKEEKQWDIRIRTIEVVSAEENTCAVKAK